MAHGRRPRRPSEYARAVVSLRCGHRLVRMICSTLSCGRTAYKSRRRSMRRRWVVGPPDGPLWSPLAGKRASASRVYAARTLPSGHDAANRCLPVIFEPGDSSHQLTMNVGRQRQESRIKTSLLSDNLIMLQRTPRTSNYSSHGHSTRSRRKPYKQPWRGENERDGFERCTVAGCGQTMFSLVKSSSGG